MQWTNFFVTSLGAPASEGHLPAGTLRKRIETHDGREAYHCAYDLEPRPTFTAYTGSMRPALGFVWFDFDSVDDGKTALDDTRRFCERIGVLDLFVCFSGSKGFHVGVPFGYFGMDPSSDLSRSLQKIATRLKKDFSTLDTVIYNANRKFRVLGSRHPKTGLFKRRVQLDQNLEAIRLLAKERGPLEIPVPEIGSPLEIFKLESPQKDSLTHTEMRAFKATNDGHEALKKCLFLAHSSENRASISEPEWYAAASIVGRFKDGAKLFDLMSKGHPGYSQEKTHDKLTQSVQVSGPRTCKGIEKLWSGCHNCTLYEKIKSPVQIFAPEVIPTEATGFYDVIVKGEKITRAPNYGDLLRKFKLEHPYKSIADMKSIYVFNGKHYCDFTPIEIKAFSESKFNPEPKENMRREFLSKVESNSVDRRSFFIETTENRLNFNNKVLDLKTKEEFLHSPEFGFRGVLPYDFDPDAACPTFEWFLSDVMLGDTELIAILQEFMGYVIRGGEYKYHKALWLAGTGRNGKSTFLKVLKDLLGRSNYETVSISQIIHDKYASSMLDGKLANFSEETSPEDLSDSGPFKNLTGDGELVGQKKYGDPYSFRNRAKLIMTYNEIPMIKDLSPGMQSRPLVIPWDRDLMDESIQDKEIDLKLSKELPGILNFAIQGWDRLEKQRRFTHSAKSQAALDTVFNTSCSAFQFVESEVKFLDLGKQDVKVSGERLYDQYVKKLGKYAYSKMKFFKRVARHPEMVKRKGRSEIERYYFAMSLNNIQPWD